MNMMRGSLIALGIACAACGGSSSSPPCGDDGAASRADAKPPSGAEQALLEGATLSLSCSAPTASASLQLDLTEVIPTADGTFTLTANGPFTIAAIGGGLGNSVPRGIDGTSTLTCEAGFVDIGGGQRYLNLQCVKSIGNAGVIFVRIGYTDPGAYEGAVVGSAMVGSVVCDGNNLGHSAQYDVTLSGTPDFTLANETRTLSGG